jgi:hypothetical protein
MLWFGCGVIYDEDELWVLWLDASPLGIEKP